MKPIVGSGRYRYNKLINQENNLWAKTSERSVLASFCSLGTKVQTNVIWRKEGKRYEND